MRARPQRLFRDRLLLDARCAYHEGRAVQAVGAGQRKHRSDRPVSSVVLGEHATMGAVGAVQGRAVLVSSIAYESRVRRREQSACQKRARKVASVSQQRRLCRQRHMAPRARGCGGTPRLGGGGPREQCRDGAPAHAVEQPRLAPTAPRVRAIRFLPSDSPRHLRRARGMGREFHERRRRRGPVYPSSESRLQDGHSPRRVPAPHMQRNTRGVVRKAGRDDPGTLQQDAQPVHEQARIALVQQHFYVGTVEDAGREMAGTGSTTEWTTL